MKIRDFLFLFPPLWGGQPACQPESFSLAGMTKSGRDGLLSIQFPYSATFCR